MNIEKLKNFDKYIEFPIKEEENKFIFFNNPIGVNTNQNANPIVKLNIDENKENKPIKEPEIIEDGVASKKSKN